MRWKEYGPEQILDKTIIFTIKIGIAHEKLKRTSRCIHYDRTCNLESNLSIKNSSKVAKIQKIRELSRKCAKTFQTLYRLKSERKARLPNLLSSKCVRTKENENQVLHTIIPISFSCKCSI